MRRNSKEDNYQEKENRKSRKAAKKKAIRSNREFTIVAYCYILLFLALIGYIVYFQVVRSEDVINNPYNKRQEMFAKQIIRGNITSSDGKILATTKCSDGKETRVYPYGSTFAHAIGYSTHGNTGVESIANFYLLRSHSFIGDQLMNMLKGEKNQGDTVVTTLNATLQESAYSALKGHEGAVIALEPTSGKILCMVSKPDYDPNDIKNNYDSIVGDDNSDSKNSVLLNRATQGSYTPGSTFKIFTTLEYLKEHGVEQDFQYDCTGSTTKDGCTIHCSSGEVHGSINLEEAFAESCNCTYATIGLNLNLASFQKLSKKLLFNQTLPTEYPSKSSSFTLNKDSSVAEIMQGCIGQDKITVSPMHLAMISSAIANNGVLMRPYVIDSIINDAGTVVNTTESEEYATLLSEETAAKMQQLMEAAVEYGTAKKLKTDAYVAAGKTGSAQVSDTSDDTHSWFVGYAKDSNGKTIAIAVIVEKEGNGSKYAVPIAKKVFDAYF